MPVTASNATFARAAFRTEKKASWITSSTGFLTKGADKNSDHYLRTALNPLTMIHPRPASTYTFTSIWSKWTPEAPYYAYPAAYGGNFPYKWTLQGQPSGMVINTDFDGTSYATRAAHGRITWPTPIAGDYTFTVRCTDQEGNTVSQIVNLNVNAANAIWVDPAGIDSPLRAGTKLDPFQKIDNWYGGTAGTGIAGDRSDSTYANKIVIYRAGTYVVPEDEATLLLNFGSNKPCTHVAYYGETVELDCSNSAFRWATGNSAGSLDRAELLGLTFSGEDEAELSQVFQVFFANPNIIVCDHTVKDWKNGGTAANNPSSFCNADKGASAWYDYCQFRNVQFTGLGGGTNLTQTTCSAFEMFTIRHFEISNFKLVSQAGSVGNFIKLKHYSQKGVIRLTEAPSFTTGFTGFQICDDTGDPPGADGIEIEYNCMGTTGGNAIQYASLAVTPGNYGNGAIRRNTFLTRPAYISERTTGELIRGANVLVNAAADWTDDATWAGHIDEESLDRAATSGIVDASGNLTGADRTTYLGIKGWEIA